MLGVDIASAGSAESAEIKGTQLIGDSGGGTASLATRHANPDEDRADGSFTP